MMDADKQFHESYRKQLEDLLFSGDDIKGLLDGGDVDGAIALTEDIARHYAGLADWFLEEGQEEISDTAYRKLQYALDWGRVLSRLASEYSVDSGMGQQMMGTAASYAARSYADLALYIRSNL